MGRSSSPVASGGAQESHFFLILVLLALIAVVPPAALAQSIVTVADGGPIGDGLVATRALLNHPWDIALDAEGNLYIADWVFHRVRKVDAATGIISTFAGGGTSGVNDGGPATLAEIERPEGLAFDLSGNLVIAQSERVRRVDRRTGVISTIAGGGDAPFEDGAPATTVSLGECGPVAIDRRGNLYLTNNATSIAKIDTAGRIWRIAGNDNYGFSGDGGPATLAEFSGIFALILDSAGNLFVSDQGNNRVRRVDATTGIVTTFAGNGSQSPTRDGGPATEAGLGTVAGIVFDGVGNLYMSAGGVIRKVERATRTITTWEPAPGVTDFGPGSLQLAPQGGFLLSGGGTHLVRRIALDGRETIVAGGGPIGEGTPAIAATLYEPLGIAIAPDGDPVFADSGSNRVRRLDRATGNLNTILGNGADPDTGDGGPATAATISLPTAIDYDAAGNLSVTSKDRLRRIDAATGLVTTVASGLGRPSGIAIAKSGDLFVSEACAHRVLRIASGSGAVSVFAGTGQLPLNCPFAIEFSGGGFGGDGGPATRAQLDSPWGLALDAEENLFIADRGNHRVRRVDAKTGIMTTFAGGGTDDFDGIQATDLKFQFPTDVAFDKDGKLFIVSHAVHRIEGGRSWRVAGGTRSAQGDSGPAIDAGFSSPSGLALDQAGNLFISDLGNVRIRAVYTCVPLSKPQLTSPDNAASEVPTAASLTWSLVDRAFRYDVLVDTVNPPKKFATRDLTSNVFTASNLKPGTTYYWYVIAKGDSLCYVQSVTGSEKRSFTTATACQAPAAFDLTGPADGSAGLTTAPTLTWNAAPGASAYDVYLGSSNPPPLAATVTTTTWTPPALVAGTSYSWFVVAHASCDTTRTTRTTTRGFTVAGGCNAAASFALTSPLSGATNVPPSASFEWSISANASSYDLYLGTTDPPPLYLPGLTKASVDVSGLSAGRVFTWRVVAKVSCDSSKNFATPTSSFMTRSECTTPGPTSIAFSPAGRVGSGQTYAIAWSAASGLAAEGTYLVERSLDASFSSVVDSQQVMATSASFVAQEAATYYHRVRAVAGCDATKQGPVSGTKAVTAVDASPNVVFTLQPEALVSPIGRNLEDNRGSFALENISNSTLQVILGKAEIESAPFFGIVDPEGGDGVFVTLLPHQPKAFELRFSGPPNDRDGSFQGLVIASVAGSPIVPYAFVNLKVGAGTGTAPRLRFGGSVSEYAFFPGLDGDDAERAPITVQIDNPGSSAMDVAAEIGPEVWLVPESGWNTAPIPAGSSRSVKLYTRRNRAPNGSALPRYTYLTVRTRSGAASRMLVQDNGASSVTQGRAELLGSNVRSLVVPDVVSTTERISRIRLSNVASDPVQATLVLTPTGSDGFDRAAVHSAIVVVPPNDVAALTDPLVQIFGLTRPASGQIEVVTAQEKIGFLTVSSSLATPADAAARAVEIPTLWRGEGARAGAAHVVPGVTLSGAETTSLTLVETSGVDGASVKLTLVDKDGVARGNKTKTILRYGRIEITSIVADLAGLTSMTAGRVEIEVVSGGGSVVGIATISDPAGASGAAITSRPSGGPTAGKQQWTDESAKMPWAESAGSVALAVPLVTSSATATGLRTLLGLMGAKSTAITFTITFTDVTGSSVTKTVTVPAGAVIEYPNVLAELLGLVAAAQGTLLIEMTPAGGDAYSRLLAAPTGGSPSAAGTLPIVPTGSPGLTSAAPGQQRPLYLDGLEQSTDSTRGFRWNLYLTELRGSAGIVTVSLYEAGNRTVPIATKTIAIGALRQLRLETVFSALGLDSEERRKERTNVMVSVTPVSGTGLISACATSVDNKTGDTKAHLLAPAGGVPATTTPSLAAPVGNGRKHPVRR